jgi:hypothetical protein
LDFRGKRFSADCPAGRREEDFGDISFHISSKRVPTFTSHCPKTKTTTLDGAIFEAHPTATTNVTISLQQLKQLTTGVLPSNALTVRRLCFIDLIIAPNE